MVDIIYQLFDNVIYMARIIIINIFIMLNETSNLSATQTIYEKYVAITIILIQIVF